MTPTKKPTLNFLRGCTTISPELREALGIEEGVLVGEARSWNDVPAIIEKYFNCVDYYELGGNALLNSICSALNDLSNLQFIENRKKKIVSDRVVMLNDVALVVPQAQLLKDYCKSTKDFLSSTTMKSKFILEYAKTRERENKKRERIRRQEEENEEKEKMLHKGKMVAYLVVEEGSSQIRNELQTHIPEERDRSKDKGKRKATQEEQEEQQEEDRRRTKARTELPTIEEEGEEEDRRGAKASTASPTPTPTPTPTPANQNLNDISFTSISSGGTFEPEKRSADEISSPVLAYIKSFDEISPIIEDDLFELSYISQSLPIAERLDISGIDFDNTMRVGRFLPDPLDTDITNMINKFTRAVEYHTDDMLLAPNKIEHINIVSLLNTTFFNNRKEVDAQQYNYRYYEAPEELKNMENDFKIKYVVSFINAVFDVNDDFVVHWDAPLDIYHNSNMKLQERQTTDAKFKTTGGIEIGVVEIKPFNTPAEMIEADRIRLAEISKKMLHKRILSAKSERELFTFAIMIAGVDIEYFVHEYNSENAKKYTFRLLKKTTLPTFPRTFSSMSLSLESLYHFKKMMTDSLASPADLEKPYLFKDTYKEFEPTITVLKLSDD